MSKQKQLLSGLLTIFPMFYRSYQLGVHFAKMQECKRPKFFPHNLKDTKPWDEQATIETINNGECFTVACCVFMAHKAILRPNSTLKMYTIEFANEQRHCWLGIDNRRYDVAFPQSQGTTYPEFKTYFDHVLVSKCETESNPKTIIKIESMVTTARIIFRQWESFIRAIYRIKPYTHF